MRKFIFTIICIITLSFTTASASETWYVDAYGGLNCREQPSETASILTTYSRGTELQIIGVDNTGVWYESWDGTVQGWVHSSYLTSEQHLSGMPLGKMRITGYTPDPSENGGETANCFGEELVPLVGHMVAVDPTVIPLKHHIYIDGLDVYETRDTGVRGQVIDVLVNTDAEARALTGLYNVYLCD